MNLGDATFVLYALFVIAQLILRGKRRQWYDLLQLPLSSGVQPGAERI